MTEISIPSPAKLNLGLLIKERRTDNYHNIETIFTTIDLFDYLSISLVGRGIKVASDNKEIPSNEKNLVYKACVVFYHHLGKRYGTKVFIENHIPPGRGLGGASSNAAQTLKGLNFLFGSPFPKEDLIKMARLVGSDCPFFISGGASYATGRGDCLEPFKMKGLKFFLYCPEIKIPTAWAYSKIFGLTKSDFSLIVLRKKLEKGDLTNMRRFLRNDFEPVVFNYYPQLLSIKKKIDENTLGACLTGSGSGLFGIIGKKGDEGKEQKIIKKLRREGIRGKVVQSLDWDVV